MVSIGNFFFKYRNWVFILFYGALFIPSPDLFSREMFGNNYYIWPIVTGLSVTISGQLIRGCTIGLAYIGRGGMNGKPHADELVTRGIFRHTRNPLYIGNILMLLGVGILSNSVYFVCTMIPVFLFIYQSIILAEEKFLRGKFGFAYDAYTELVSRWGINFSGIRDTFSSMYFNWRRWLLREHGTQFIWLCGITLLILLNYPEVTAYNVQTRNYLLIGILSFLLILYLSFRWLKKTGQIKD